MAISIKTYDNFMLDVGGGRINLETDTFKLELVNNYVYNRTHEDRDDVSGKLSSGNGYTSGGQALTGVSWTFNNGIYKFTANDVSWLADGGTIGGCTGAIIYSDTSAGDKLCYYIDFGEAKDAPDTIEFKIVFNINGIGTWQQTIQ